MDGDVYKKKSVEYLKECNVKLPCPRCDSLKFEILGKGDVSVSEDMVIPVAVIVCNGCGFISQHYIYWKSEEQI